MDGGITASGIDDGLGHVVGAKRTDIPRELCVLFVFSLHSVQPNSNECRVEIFI